jgi:hypothetical protein
MSKTKSFNVPLPGGIVLPVPIGKIYQWRNITLVIHHPVRNGAPLKNWWNVSEYSTGRTVVSKFFDTIKAAERHIEEYFPQLREGIFEECIAEALKINL